MPKASHKYYAVRVGREGAKIYDTWDECKENVARWPRAVHKSFKTRPDAEKWLADAPNTSSSPTLDTMLASSTANGSGTSEAPFVVDSDDSDVEMISGPRPRTPSLTKFNEEEDFIPLESAPELSKEQQEVLRKVQSGQSVFFTGSAGTGKSVLLREIIRALSGSRLAITASTGIASVNIGGTTLHSWAGVGLGDETAEKLAGKILGQKGPALTRWREVKTLIIDEISMIDGALFDKLETIGRKIRRNDRPFGGIQLVLSGDFCQLPPVPDRRKVASQATFAFDAASWAVCVGRPVALTKVFRQKDQKFVDMLNAMRFQQLSDEAVHIFTRLSRKVAYDDDIEPTQLYSTRREVDNANTNRLKALPGKAHTYISQDVPGRDARGNFINRVTMGQLLERLIAPKEIDLKVGAQVMLIKNLQQGHLVNGSLGRIVDFATGGQALRDQTDIGSMDKEAHRIYAHNQHFWPVVQFTNGRRVLCVPAEFTVNNAHGEVEARRDQVPLILSWALSVHKSQGQTLERVRVDLGSTFEKGQAYVALSRATSLDTLQVLRFDKSKVQAHPRVLEFYRDLGTYSEYFQKADEYDDLDDEEAVAAYYDY